VTLKGQTRDPNLLRVQYLENSWRCYLATIATDQAIDQWRVHLNARFKAKGKYFGNML